jgi:hypothetical protein
VGRKPCKDSARVERLDTRNGLAACAAHDVAFETGMLTVNGGLRIHLARLLADAVRTDPLASPVLGPAAAARNTAAACGALWHRAADTSTGTWRGSLPADAKGWATRSVTGAGERGR